jgi:uncharacterized protein YciI
MFYLCEGILASPLPVPEAQVRDELHPKHVQFIADGVEKGVVIFGGPKSGVGGIVLVKAPSLDACQAFLNGDPMVIAGAQSYRISEFRIIEHNPCLDPLLTDE